MSKYFMLVLMVLTFSSASAQKIVVPELVKNSFTQKYPAVTGVKWDQENGNYEAEFLNNKVETSVVFDASGALLETEVSMDPASLPVKIQDYCKMNLPGKKIKEASKITAANGTVSFEAEISGADYIFNEKGEFVTKKEAAVEGESPVEENRD